jgi:hypothetical protein
VQRDGRSHAEGVQLERTVHDRVLNEEQTERIRIQGAAERVDAMGLRRVLGVVRGLDLRVGDVEADRQVELVEALAPDHVNLLVGQIGRERRVVVVLLHLERDGAEVREVLDDGETLLGLLGDRIDVTVRIVTELGENEIVLTNHRRGIRVDVHVVVGELA